LSDEHVQMNVAFELTALFSASFPSETLGLSANAPAVFSFPDGRPLNAK
jgi:hypothetical protein